MHASDTYTCRTRSTPSPDRLVQVRGGPDALNAYVAACDWRAAREDPALVIESVNGQIQASGERPVAAGA